MPSRADTRTELIARRQTDIDNLRRAVQLVKKHNQAGAVLAVKVLSDAIRTRTNSLRNLTRRKHGEIAPRQPPRT